MVSDLDRGILMQFGIRLKSLRQSKNLTLRKMALLCNVEYADIQRYETGKQNITLLSGYSEECTPAFRYILHQYLQV